MLNRLNYLKLYNTKIDKKPRFIEQSIVSDLSTIDSNGNKQAVTLRARYGILEGIASTTMYQSGQKVKIEPYAFAESLAAKDLNSLRGIRFKFDHKYETVYDASGIIKKLEYSDNGSTLCIEVWIRVGLSSINSDEIKDDPKNMKVYLDSILGTAGFSVGFRAVEQEIVPIGNIIYKADLEEVSLTKYPSDVYAYACSDTETNSGCEICKNKGAPAMDEETKTESTTNIDLATINTKLADLSKSVESLVTTLPDIISKTVPASSVDEVKVDNTAEAKVETSGNLQQIDLSSSSMQELASHITNAIKDVMGASKSIDDRTADTLTVESNKNMQSESLNDNLVIDTAFIQNLADKFVDNMKGAK